MIKLLIYDLDGTLIDSRADIAHSVNWMLKQLGFKELELSAISGHVGEGVAHLMKSVLKLSSGRDEEKLVERAVKLYRGRYAEHLLDQTKLYPSVKGVLEHFKSRQQAVITNKPEGFSRQILKALGVGYYFFRIVGGDQAIAKKPSPGSVFELMRSLGVEAREAVFIGDSEIDIQTGKNAGIYTIGVTYGFKTKEHVENARPDFVYHDLNELLSCPILV
jgi:phosphoglycolate phosphatase